MQRILKGTGTRERLKDIGDLISSIMLVVKDKSMLEHLKELRQMISRADSYPQLLRHYFADMMINHGELRVEATYVINAVDSLKE